MRRKYIFSGIIFLIVLLPLWMFLAWYFTSKKKLVAAIIDKTVSSKNWQNHSSLTWVLNHEKFSKTSTKTYNVSKDYFGFFPQLKDASRTKGLERFSSSEINQLSIDCDVAYVTDTYGIDKNINSEGPIIYGGMSEQDIDFLEKMKARNKLIIAEFNSIGPPTTPQIRKQFEDLFGLNWTGWIGRFFNSLDTSINKEIPAWLVADYANQHNGKWPFKKPGIAFINNERKVVILEEGKDLNNPLPYIESNNYSKEILGLPLTMKYNYWFDVTLPDTLRNKVIAEFNIDVNDNGAKQLLANGLPGAIPAIIMHKADDYEFYYFCGDFCNNPISVTSSYFKGISVFENFFYKEDDLMERESFFWKFYKPLLTNILTNYYNKVHH